MRSGVNIIQTNFNNCKKCSALGPSGFSAEHLKVAIIARASNCVDKCNESVTKLVNTILGGKVPDNVAKFFFCEITQ